MNKTVEEESLCAITRQRRKTLLFTEDLSLDAFIRQQWLLTSRAIKDMGGCERSSKSTAAIHEIKDERYQTDKKKKL